MRSLRNCLTRVALAAAIAAGAPLAAQAQSLQALYEAARGYDATFLSAKALADSARYRAAQSEALARPSAALVGSATATRIYPQYGPNGDSNALAGSLNGQYTLFNRSNDATIAQARESLKSAQADLEAAQQDLIVRVAQAYFDVLGAQDNLATTRANKVAITEQLASAKRNFEVGTATITDTREAQSRFDLAVAQELQAENDLHTKRIALDQLVGRSGVAPDPLRVPVVLPAPLPDDAEAWVTVGDTRSPSVRRARVALDVARLETEKARAGSLPTLNAVASVGTERDTGNYVLRAGTNRTASIGLQFNLPLYTGGAVQNRLEETLVLEDKARNDLDAARRGVAQGVRVAFYNLKSGLAQVKALEAAEASSKLSLEATQLGYKVGVRVNVDVLNAQSQLYQTQRDLAQARYNVLLGTLKLRQAAGELGDADIEAVNSLLAQ
ncbi:MAG: channel protein TolC [Rubrivivax sp. SCN 70-15]|nr:MAG: channel protein TolC [Rubrivivax sp. SCN 70-15]